MLLLAELLPRSAFDVSFILMWERGAWAAEADALGVPVHVLGLRPPGSSLRPRNAIAAARAIRQYLVLARQIDIVDAWLIPSYTFAALLQPIARVPVVIAGHRGLMGLYERKPWYRRAAASWAVRHVDAVVANSNSAAKEAIEQEGIDPARVELIPNAVLQIDTDHTDRGRQRLAWGFGPDEVVVGCVANYKPGKGLETLVEIAARSRATAPHLRYVLIGEGPLHERLERQIADYDLGSIVILHGAADDARRLLPALDIAVQASNSEGLPNAVLEACAAGLAIVATAVGGTTDILTDGVDGIVVPQTDTAALEAAILYLATDGESRARLGAAALVRSGAFSVARLTDATATLYERLLADR